MNMRKANERCPLQAECERRCDYEFREHECDYYQGNARPGYELEDDDTATYDIPMEGEEVTEPEADATQKDAGVLVFIPVDRLHPHPDNPRKDIGDISELTESIRENGIFQNLTVVPDDPENSITDFTVIIGHRRLAAAVAAGLESVPCWVARMTPEEQITTMLSENMHRADLTIYEQAKGFQQLSLDMGMSAADISKKSGCSKTTVRSRLKLAELDELDGAKFKAAVSRGATLFDFAELDKVDDPEDKARCLEAIGTANFKNTLKSTLEDQRYRQKKGKWIEQLSEFATEVEAFGDGMHYVRNYGRWTSAEDVERPEDADTVKYFFHVSLGQIDVYREFSPGDEEAKRQADEKAAIRAKYEARWEEAQEIMERHRQLRREFVLEYGSAKSNAQVIMRNAAAAMATKGTSFYGELDKTDLCRMLNIHYDEENKCPDPSQLRQRLSELPEWTLLVTTYWYMDRFGGYAHQRWDTEKYQYVTEYQDNQTLDNLYYFLEELGYQRSDEERQMCKATHPVFDEVEENAE